jgi:hypothetical protein
MTGATDEFPAEIDPQDAFQLFSHELRLEILFALWEAPHYSLAFSEIQEAVGERDSGKFTYHLEQLTGHFVAEIEGQYVLQFAGHRVIDAIQSGVFHSSPTVPPTEAPGTCSQCGTTPLFEYDEHLATVSCPDCETKLVEYPFDPGGFQDRSIEAAIETFDRRTKTIWRLASSGVCFVCAGRVNVTYTDSAAEMDHHDRYDRFFAADHPALFHLSCQNCSFYSYIPVGIRLLDSPAVLGHLASRGADSTDRFLWELPFMMDADCVTVRDHDPWEVLIEVPTATGQLDVTLADDATVHSLAIDP